jgi:hypothetical protein
MRFPDIPLMETTFSLFRRLNYGPETQIPYYLSTPDDVQLFNGFLVSGPVANEEDPFRVSTSNGGLVPDEFSRRGYAHWLEEKLCRFREALVDDFDSGWKLLMTYDAHSFRSYMTLDDTKCTEDPNDPQDGKYPTSVGLVLLLPHPTFFMRPFCRSLTGARQWIRGQVYSMVH